MPYSVTKAAQLHLVKCLAVTVGPKIRVNTVLPGLLLTEWVCCDPPLRLFQLCSTIELLPSVGTLASSAVGLTSYLGQQVLARAHQRLERRGGAQA